MHLLTSSSSSARSQLVLRRLTTPGQFHEVDTHTARCPRRNSREVPLFFSAPRLIRQYVFRFTPRDTSPPDSGIALFIRHAARSARSFTIRHYRLPRNDRLSEVRRFNSPGSTSLTEPRGASPNLLSNIRATQNKSVLSSSNRRRVFDHSGLRATWLFSFPRFSSSSSSADPLSCRTAIPRPARICEQRA